MATIHFHKPPQWHWLPSSHRVVQFLPDSKYCYSHCFYQWLFVGVELRLNILNQAELG